MISVPGPGQDGNIFTQSVLVTGAAGFIGSHLVRRLLSQGTRVVGIDNFSAGKRSNLPNHPDLRVILGDVTTDDGMRIVEHEARNVDWFVHLAANPSVHDSVVHPLRSHEVNAVASLRLFEWAGRAGVAQTVFASSAAVYGDSPQLPLREDGHVKPMSPYGIDKLASEGYGDFYANRFGFSTFNLRFMNVYGPGQSAAYAGVLTKFKECLERGESPTVYGDGSQTRDFIHVDDVVSAIVAALSSGLGGTNTFNIGTGVGVSINEILGILAGWFEFDCLFAPARPGEISQSFADVSLAEAKLGWQPRTALRDGLHSLFADLLPVAAPR